MLSAAESVCSMAQGGDRETHACAREGFGEEVSSQLSMGWAVRFVCVRILRSLAAQRAQALSGKMVPGVAVKSCSLRRRSAS